MRTSDRLRVHLLAFHLDPVLALAYALLCVIGLVVLYSASGGSTAVLLRHLAHLLVAVVALVLLSQQDTRMLKRCSPPVYVLTLLLLVAVLLFGVSGKGAQRWLDLGIIRFQPSELMKVALPMALCWLIARRALPLRAGAGLTCLAVLALPAWLVAAQPDFGTAALVATVGLIVVFLAGIPWSSIAVLGVGAVAMLPLLWAGLHDYQRSRLLFFLNPERDPLGAGYHAIQSKIAIGSGGLYGKGWLQGTQAQLEFLPERTTDFVFAVFCEEFGFLGFLVLLALYLVLVARGLVIAVRARHTYDQLLAASLSFSLFLYVFINMSMTIGQLPVVGVPLPLLSQGGTSLLTVTASVALLMAVARRHRQTVTAAGVELPRPVSGLP